jgi:hypothetical protein
VVASVCRNCSRLARGFKLACFEVRTVVKAFVTL